MVGVWTYGTHHLLTPETERSDFSEGDEEKDRFPNPLRLRCETWYTESSKVRGGPRFSNQVQTSV